MIKQNGCLRFCDLVLYLCDLVKCTTLCFEDTDVSPLSDIACNFTTHVVNAFPVIISCNLSRYLPKLEISPCPTKFYRQILHFIILKYCYDVNILKALLLLLFASSISLSISRISFLLKLLFPSLPWLFTFVHSAGINLS